MIFKVYVRDFKEGKKVLFSGLKKKTKKNVKLSRDVFQGVSLVRVSGSCKSLKYTPPHRSPFGVIVYFDGEGQYSGPLRTALLSFSHGPGGRAQSMSRSHLCCVQRRRSSQLPGLPGRTLLYEMRLYD